MQKDQMTSSKSNTSSVVVLTEASNNVPVMDNEFSLLVAQKHEKSLQNFVIFLQSPAVGKND